MRGSGTGVLFSRLATAAIAVAALGLAACSGSSDEAPGQTASAEPAAAAAATAPAATEDAKVDGTDFHAIGNLPCRMTTDEAPGSCPFGVTREGDGNGMVTITKPDGRKRVIFFEKGQAIGADVSEADPGEFSASREGDTTIVHIGTERFEIPDAVIMGG